MEYNVSRHSRRTQSGRTTSVRQHTRVTGGRRERALPPPQETWREDPGEWHEPAEDSASDDGERETYEQMRSEMREWRSRPEPQPSPAEPMDPQLAKALGCDTPEGRERFERGRAYREAGYDGPLDRDNRIPDPDDPANEVTLSALASMRWREGG